MIANLTLYPYLILYTNLVRIDPSGYNKCGASTYCHFRCGIKKRNQKRYNLIYVEVKLGVSRVLLYNSAPWKLQNTIDKTNLQN